MITNNLYKPKAPLFSSTNNNHVFINNDLIEFSHIDLENGNGIVAKKDLTISSDLKSQKEDLIIEPALICSVSRQVRERRRNRNNYSYCSLCGAFLLLFPSETSNIKNLTKILEYSEKIGFSKLPIWFQKRERDTKFDRCQTCHRDRVLMKEFPQSLEECEEFLFLLTKKHEEDENENEENNNYSHHPIQKYEDLAMEYDEGLFCVLRTILMLMDEVLFEIHENHHKASSSSLSDKIDEFCSSFDEGIVPSSSLSSSSSSALVFRTACQLINEILEATLAKFDSNNATFKITLQQFFLLRCVLQNNQHKAIIANPMSTLLDLLKSKKEDENQERSEVIKMIQEEFSNNDDDKESLENITASALFLHTSRLNHSCYPNAHVEPSLTRSGASVRISLYNFRADEEEEDENVDEENREEVVVKKGEQITISYIGYGPTRLFDDKIEAHEYLKKNYGFVCRD